MNAFSTHKRTRAWWVWPHDCLGGGGMHRRKTNAATMSLYCVIPRDRWLLWLQYKPIIAFLLAGCIFMKSNTRMCKHFWFQNPEFLRAPSPAAETGGILGNRWPSVSNEYVLREWSNHLLFQHALSNNLILLAVNRHALNTYSIRPKKEFFYIISLKSRLLHVRALWSKTMSVKVPGEQW